MAELRLQFPFSALTASGISAAEHELLDTLVHNLAEDAFTEILRDGNGEVTAVNFRVSAGGTFIRTTDITRNANGEVIQTVDKQYDGSGGIVSTLTTNINRSGDTVISITTVKT